MANHDPNAEALDSLATEQVPTDEETDATDGRALDGTGDIMDMAGELRLLIARADALASTTDEQFSRVALGEGADRRGFQRLAHLVELTATAVVAASNASDELIAAVERALPPERT